MQEEMLSRENAARSVAENRQEILKQAQTNSFIYLQPVPPPGQCGGHVEHYYHFLFDLILPLYFIIKSTPKNIFVLREVGPYTSWIHKLFPNRVKIDSTAGIPEEIPKIELIGMNPKCVEFTHKEIQEFSMQVCHMLGIDYPAETNRILLIERLPPDPYFITQAVNKGAGSFRRSIPNHHALVELLQSRVKPSFEFSNLQLEKLPFETQIEYFSQACLVIAQHGAGLANCIWMPPQSTVIEFNCNDLRHHFRTLSRIKNHHYFRYKTAGDHAMIELDHFASWVSNHSHLQTFFH